MVIVDHDEQASTGRVTIVITGVNDAPISADDGPFSTSSLDPIVIDVLANDIDVDGMLQLVSATRPTLGTVMSGNTEISGNSVRFVPEHPSPGLYVFQYTAADAAGAQVTGSVSVNVRTGVQVTIDSLTSSRSHIVG